MLLRGDNVQVMGQNFHCGGGAFILVCQSVESPVSSWILEMDFKDWGPPPKTLQ